MEGLRQTAPARGFKRPSRSTMRTSGRDPVNLYRLPFPHPGPNAWLQSPDAIHSADSIQPPDAQTLDLPCHFENYVAKPFENYLAYAGSNP